MAITTVTADAVEAVGVWADPKAARGVGSIPAKVTLGAGTTATWEIIGKANPSAPGLPIWKSDRGKLDAQIRFYPYVELNVTAISAGGSVTMTLDSWPAP